LLKVFYHHLAAAASNADYGEDHVAGIRRYMRLHDLGFPPPAIKVLLEAREDAPFVVAPGVTPGESHMT
jgi:hypothetical protein